MGSYTSAGPAPQGGGGWADPLNYIATNGADPSGTGIAAGGGFMGMPPAPWTCSENCSNDSEVFSFHPGGGNMCFGDGSVRFVVDGLYDGRIIRPIEPRRRRTDQFQLLTRYRDEQTARYACWPFSSLMSALRAATAPKIYPVSGKRHIPGSAGRRRRGFLLSAGGRPRKRPDDHGHRHAGWIV